MGSLTKAKVRRWLRENKSPTLEATLQQFSECARGHPGRFTARITKIHDNYMAEQTAFETALEIDEQEAEPVVGGTMEAPDVRRQEAHGKTFVLTCAQNNTDLIPDEWWRTLLNLVDHYGAELHISRFTYNKAAYGNKAVKPGSKKASDEREIYYDERIDPYVSDEDIQLAPDLVWLGGLNVLPTAVNPITGFQTHTRQMSCIIPHAKIAMESVATMKVDPAKFVYTTGAVTQRNYIQKSAGQKADFHHVFGALLVEVDEEGNWWTRQLNFDTDGGLYDLNKFFTPTEVFEQVRVQAVTHGDIHGFKMDDDICHSVFGKAGALNKLWPREQFFHDIIDFMPRNHHNMKSFQFQAEMHKDATESVEEEFDQMSLYLMNKAYRDWCASFVVVSNHDQAFNLWLDNVAGLYDPVNMELWLRYNHLRAVQGDSTVHPFVHLMTKHCADYGQHPVSRCTPTFLKEDSSYKILDEIEAAMHGHLGPNGARGAPRNIRTAGKANTGHTHSAGIVEGVYTAGVYGKLDMGYNRGLSSWSHSMIVTYPNKKRAILTHNSKGWWR